MAAATNARSDVPTPIPNGHIHNREHDSAHAGGWSPAEENPQLVALPRSEALQGTAELSLAPSPEARLATKVLAQACRAKKPIARRHTWANHLFL